MVIINPLFLELETGALEKLNKIATLSATKSLTNPILEHSTMQDFFLNSISKLQDKRLLRNMSAVTPVS